MAEALVVFLRQTLPDGLAEYLEVHIANLENANFAAVFQDPYCQKLLGRDMSPSTYEVSKAWNDYIFENLEFFQPWKDDYLSGNVLDSPQYKEHFLLIVALSALGAFLQSNVTGPPLPFSSANILFPQDASVDPKTVKVIRQRVLNSFEVDGESPYRLTPQIELLALADTILTCPPVAKLLPASRWARLRTDFLHQRILSGTSPILEKSIYEGIEAVKSLVLNEPSQDTFVPFLLEVATIHTHHGYDKLAKEALQEATKKRHFEHAITGMLGKRTKFQQKDTSQLVLLAKSSENTTDAPSSIPTSSGGGAFAHEKHALPQSVELNDDTLLEKISFTKSSNRSNDSDPNSVTHPPQVIQDEHTLSPSLAALDPEKQPQLNPLDSIILLSEAASITNINPADGLTREETAPYATRVLEGGSSNWQVYTQALLLRSRIEGYKSRTVERGLLQLQALVDQVIADTGSAEDDPSVGKPATFLPKATEKESAPASQRLLYIYALCSPTRWDLEAELAARWVNLGGLRSALDIYERLEMWPEAALCWAATDRDDKARKIVRKQLFHATSGADEDANEETETWSGASRDPQPSDAPRMYCILGDIDKDPEMYEKAWAVSNQRYSRAQRSLGRHYYNLKDPAKASLAYSKSLQVKALDHGSWFAFGCALLELDQFKRAAEAFTRAAQIDHDDAESWSNMAAALLQLSPGESPIELKEDAQAIQDVDVGEDEITRLSDPQKNRKAALKALKQAARLKQENHRIWDNLLTVAATLEPPSWTDMLTSQTRIIDIRGSIDGEKCIDTAVMSALINHIIATTEAPSDGEGFLPGLAKMTVQLVEKRIISLITASAPLWRLVAKLALWRNKPSSALEAYEKAWRVVTTQPGWEHDTEKRWDEVVDATLELVGAYESLGGRTKTEGLGAGDALVAKDWKFKARSAVRGIKGKGKDSWDNTNGWLKLDAALEDLKAA